MGHFSFKRPPCRFPPSPRSARTAASAFPSQRASTCAAPPLIAPAGGSVRGTSTARGKDTSHGFMMPIHVQESARKHLPLRRQGQRYSPPIPKRDWPENGTLQALNGGRMGSLITGRANGRCGQLPGSAATAWAIYGRRIAVHPAARSFLTATAAGRGQRIAEVMHERQRSPPFPRASRRQ